ncbi:hypothetical protein [Pontibacter indicus]|uniref:Uncharacterized protein n=1 Tax=Pontibacter indicus TaxID=1317125 RepID=A0A1R3XQ07_9BACT|nr:hypothetical protein [Pontibacter indicus]SIT93999.1 hypothetical protein SAMN05444128_3382 [Pontibacter indicus]
MAHSTPYLMKAVLQKLPDIFLYRLHSFYSPFKFSGIHSISPAPDYGKKKKS